MDYSIFSQTYTRDPFTQSSRIYNPSNPLKDATDATALWWANIPLYKRVRKECPALYDHPGMKWMRRATRIILLTVFIVLAVAAATTSH